jgi:hypothetical protein
MPAFAGMTAMAATPAECHGVTPARKTISIKLLLPCFDLARETARSNAAGREPPDRPGVFAAQAGSRHWNRVSQAQSNLCAYSLIFQERGVWRAAAAASISLFRAETGRLSSLLFGR